MPKKHLIDPANDHFGCVLNCAVRYAIGRETYMPGLVCDYVTPLFPYLSDKTLYVFEQDVSDAKSYGDPLIDAPIWERFLDAVRREIERRKIMV